MISSASQLAPHAGEWVLPFESSNPERNLSLRIKKLGIYLLVEDLLDMFQLIIFIHFPPLQITSNLGVNKNTHPKTNMLERKNELLGGLLFPFHFRVIFRFQPLVFRGKNRWASSNQGAKKWPSEKECKPPSPEGSRLGPLHG